MRHDSQTIKTMKKLEIDMENSVVIVEIDGSMQRYGLDTKEAFSVMSEAWLRCGWETKYVYSFTWLGRPIIQLPEDIVRIQEVIFQVKPDVIVETGIAHGGSLIFYASLCKLLGKGRVIGVDIEIRQHNRKAIEENSLYDLITLYEGSSVDPSIVEKVKGEVGEKEKVIVFLDSCHAKAHVLAELRAYSSLVSPGSYIVAMDGIMEMVAGAPRTEPDWIWNNPKQAAIEFAHDNPEFVIEEPSLLFNEGSITERVTYSPGAYIKRKK